ncbi:hypothetical protein KSP35_05080 [Aquihabitans sp. G128]|uniref:hypothetical protein n=1 Tax=Aquihabitans sp. G128 TaxID=2849779 RepID=UPI001C21DF6E|nr:hypothetical protein [Aquihabitans sp. G128]QXC62185.1 hypothetical protein KSP35_05080 [Aquihabitans sp. G128]
MTRSVVPEGARARLAAFAAVLLVAFGGAFVAGSALGSDPAPSRERHPTSTSTTVAPGAHDMEGMGS